MKESIESYIVLKGSWDTYLNELIHLIDLFGINHQKEVKEALDKCVIKNTIVLPDHQKAQAMIFIEDCRAKGKTPMIIKTRQTGNSYLKWLMDSVKEEMDWNSKKLLPSNIRKKKPKSLLT